MTTLVLALALAQQKTVTFTHPCAPAATVLKALGDNLGIAIKPGGSVNKDFIILRFENVTPEEALKRLAEGLNATWTTENGVHYLTRTGTQENQEKLDARKEQTKLVQEWLDKRKVEGNVTIENSLKLIEDVIPLTKMPPNGQYDQQADQKRRELEASGPVARYLTRVLKEIGAASLADIEEGERVQFVPNPNANQRRLPSGEAERLLAVETAIHKEALMRSGALDRMAEGTMYSSLIHPYADRYGRTSERTVLTVRRERGYYSIQLEIAGGGQTSEVITPEREKPTGIPQELLQQKGEYAPTELEKELGRAAAVIFGGRGETTTVSAEAVTALSDPVTYEPLTIFGSQWMLEASKALGRNLVGVLSDDCSVASMFMSSQNQLGFAQFWTFLPQMGTGYKVSLDERWLTVYPLAPIKVRDDRLDREDWKRAIARGRPGKRATLEDLAAYAALSDDEVAVMMATLPAAFMGHGISMDDLGRAGNLDALRLFGRLTAQQQKAARNGGTELLLSRMNPDLSRVAWRLTSARSGRIEQKRRTLGWGDPDMGYPMGGEDDPMQLLGRGFPPASVVRVYVLIQDVVHQQAETGYGRSQGSTPVRLAQQIAAAEVWPEGYEHMRPFFAVAPAEQLLIEFEFTNVGFLYHRIQFDSLPKDTKYVPLNELPAGVRAEIEAGLKKYREQYKNARGGGGGTAEGGSGDGD